MQSYAERSAILNEKLHEHARLLMMLDPAISLSGYVKQMKEEYPNVLLSRLLEVWTAYQGSVSGAARQCAWLDIETGERLPGR